MRDPLLGRQYTLLNVGRPPRTPHSMNAPGADGLIPRLEEISAVLIWTSRTSVLAVNALALRACGDVGVVIFGIVALYIKIRITLTIGADRADGRHCILIEADMGR